MVVVKAMLFGALQGLTEFLPISSSGHLAVFHHFFGSQAESMVPMGVVAHVGTLLAVVIFFWRDIARFGRALGPGAVSSLLRKPSLLFAPLANHADEGRIFFQRVLAAIVVGTIPAAVVGLLFKDAIEQAFSRVKTIGAMFFVTAALLFLTRLFGKGSRNIWQSWVTSALVIGAFQAAAIMPGISRSGATIACGIFLGFERGFAARFSFLLSIPAIAGAFVLEFNEIVSVLTTEGFAETALVFVSAFAVGYVSIAALLSIVRRGGLHLFGFYCLAAGIVTLALA